MNWIKFSWSDGTDITLPSKSGTFIVDASNVVVSDAPIIEKAKEAISIIVKNNPPPYRLLVSGGIDSQAMIYAWKESGVEFEVHTFVYDQNMNLHDLSLLWEYAKLHDIKVTHHNISHFEFLKNDLFSYSKKYSCNSPQITFYMSMMDRFTDGTLILSGNPPLNIPFFNFAILGLERYRIINRKNIVPFFWIHTAELAGAWIYLQSKHEASWVRSNFKFTENNEAKCFFYHSAKIPVIPSYKKSGFEKYKLYYDNYKIDPATKIKLLLNTKKNNKSKRNYDILFRFSLIYENPISLNFETIGI
ncbi:MAG: hypothetical protein EBU90_09810 [Proteobacteria bacterium]|nr:hypothetical protein [Pseudomonadota bacterium]NBP14547.1 hypothetical protein [bacterium]